MPFMKMQKLYGEELTELLSRGMVWMMKYNRQPSFDYPELIYSPTQAVIAAALSAIMDNNTEEFSRIHHVVDLSSFQFPNMKSWLKEDHKFNRWMVRKLLVSVARLVVEEMLPIVSPFVAAVTGLEDKYDLTSVFVQSVFMCAKQAWKGTESKVMKSTSTQTCDEVVETFAKMEDADITTPNEEHASEIMSPGTHCIEVIESGTQMGGDPNNNIGDVKNHQESISRLLQISVEMDTTEVVKTLLRYGLDVHFMDEEGNTPLHKAAFCNRLDVVHLLTSAGADVKRANISGQLPLHLTANVAVMTFLLYQGTDVNAKTGVGDTALHLAVYRGDLRAVEVLMSFGSNLNAINAIGLTPILIALHTNNKKIFDLLTWQEAFAADTCFVDLAQTSNGRLSPVIELAEEEEADKEETVSNRPRLRAEMISKVQPVTLNEDKPIHKAVTNGRLGALIRLLDSGVDVETRGYGGYTALSYAAKYGHLYMVQLLLQRGANINSTDDWNWTPLTQAAYYNHRNVVQCLINSGADPKIVDNIWGMTPFGWAKGNFKIIKLFRSNGILC